MKTKKQRAREDADAKRRQQAALNVPTDAHSISSGERLDASCESCGKRFYVDAVQLRCDGELEVRCPYCQRHMLVQHVEYACTMVIE